MKRRHALDVTEVPHISVLCTIFEQLLPNKWRLHNRNKCGVKQSYTNNGENNLSKDAQIVKHNTPNTCNIYHKRWGSSQTWPAEPYHRWRIVIQRGATVIISKERPPLSYPKKGRHCHSRREAAMPLSYSLSFPERGCHAIVILIVIPAKKRPPCISANPKRPPCISANPKRPPSISANPKRPPCISPNPKGHHVRSKILRLEVGRP